MIKEYFFRKIGLFVLELICITHISFFCERYQFKVLFFSYALAFSVYFYFLKILKTSDTKAALVFGVVARFIAVFALPHLSDDFYRFFWDGNLTLHGINVYAFKPNDLQTWLSSQNDAVKYAYYKMNSPNYNSVYPPIAQSIFDFSVFISPKNIYFATVVIKLFNFLAECGTLLFLYKLHQKVNTKAIFIYALNPFIIIELCANAHTEALMIFFFTIALYYLQKATVRSKYLVLSSLLLSFSVASKIFSVLFSLSFAQALSVKRGIVFLIIFSTSCVIIFIPFFQTLITPSLWNNSLGLYFGKFEFNASVFYLLKYFGAWQFGFDVIHVVTPILMSIFLVFAFILHLNKSFYGTDLKTFSRACLMLFYAYIVCSTTVHPWYLAFPVLFAALGGYYFPLIHSFLIVLTYAGYTQGSSKSSENLWFVLIEYGVVLIVFIIEVFQNRQSNLATIKRGTN